MVRVRQLTYLVMVRVLTYPNLTHYIKVTLLFILPSLNFHWIPVENVCTVIKVFIYQRNHLWVYWRVLFRDASIFDLHSKFSVLLFTDTLRVQCNLFWPGRVRKKWAHQNSVSCSSSLLEASRSRLAAPTTNPILWPNWLCLSCFVVNVGARFDQGIRKHGIKRHFKRFGCINIDLKKKKKLTTISLTML